MMNKIGLYLIIAVFAVAFAAAIPAEGGVLITSPGEAYGHHGNCYGWNACGDAATCALWACQVKGYTNLVSYGEAKPCTGFSVCNLFNAQCSIQYGWGNWCAVMGVTDIVCSNPSEDGQCHVVADAPQDPNSVPEFGIIGAGLILIGAVVTVAVSRKN